MVNVKARDIFGKDFRRESNKVQFQRRNQAVASLRLYGICPFDASEREPGPQHRSNRLPCARSVQVRDQKLPVVVHRDKLLALTRIPV